MSLLTDVTSLMTETATDVGPSDDPMQVMQVFGLNIIALLTSCFGLLRPIAVASES